MAVSGSGQSKLTNDPHGVLMARWSADGRYIAYVAPIVPTDQIYVMNADGSNLINVSHNSAINLDPAWKPLSK